MSKIGWYLNLSQVELAREHESLLKYMREKHSEWGFERAQEALAFCEAAMALKPPAAGRAS